MAALFAILVLAQAGGGSSGFSGGGGGGGGGGGFSGGGGGGGAPGPGGPLLFLVLLGVFVVITTLSAVGAARARRRRRERDARVRLAATEAAQDDPAFAPERVGADAATLFLDVQRAWDGGDRQRLRQLIGGDLLTEWERRLDDFDARGWHSRVQVLGDPTVEYMGLVNRADDAEDRVVVRLTAPLDVWVQTDHGQRVYRDGHDNPHVAFDEYWTLAKRDAAWTLVSIEQDAEGAHHLTDEMVVSPWSDSRLADQTLVEQAVADAIPEGFSPGDAAVVDYEGTAREAALDLALADGRFAPDVLEAAVRRAVAAWAEAVDGDDAPLEHVASEDAVDALLYAGDAQHRTRLVVRGPRVERVAIAALDAQARPATMRVSVAVRGRVYREDRATAAVVEGSRDRETARSEAWTMALDGPADAPWRLVGVSR